MATILKPVRLVNPGKRKRRLTARQKLFFGSKRQRAAVSRTLGHKRHSKRNPSISTRVGSNRKYRKAVKSGNWSKALYYNRKQTTRRRHRTAGPGSRLPNVGEIITIRPLVNSGTSKRKGTRKRRNPNNMAKSAKRRAAGLKAARTRKRNKAARSHTRRSTHRRRRSNPSVIRVVHRRRRRRSNPVMRTTRRRYVRHHRRGRRRNPGFVSGIGGSFGKIVGVIGGAMLTKTITAMVPAQFTGGILGYATIALVAYAQGKAVGKLLRNPTLGNDMALGGYVYLALKVANDYFPSLGLGLSGLGLIGGSSFYVPQVPVPGSMGTFQVPAAVMGAMPAAQVAGGMKGLGASSSMRRVGRLR